MPMAISIGVAREDEAVEVLPIPQLVGGGNGGAAKQEAQAYGEALPPGLHLRSE